MNGYKCLYCDEMGEWCNSWNFNGTQTVFVCEKHFIRHVFEFQQRAHERKKIQYWLVKLDRWGNPELCDGAHSDYDGANKSLYLRKRLGLHDTSTSYAIAKIEFLDVQDKVYSVDEEATVCCKEMLDDYKESHK